MSIKIGEKKILRSPLEPKDRNWLWLKTVAGFPVLHEYLSGKWVPFSDATAEYVEANILSRVFGSTKYDKAGHCIEFYAADGSDTPIGVIDTSEFEVSIDVDNYYTKAEVEEYVSEYVSEHGGSSADLSDYYTNSEVDTLLSGKVSVVSGKGLSTEDYTTAEKQKLAGLSNYDDTEIQAEVDAKYEKPSTGIPKTDLAPAVQASLDLADSALQSSDLEGYATTDDVDDAVAALVSSAPQTLDTLKELAEALGDDPNFATTMATQLGNKVDKETGKGLSSNDYTTAEKTKLAGIAAGAEVNVQPNWTQTNTSADDYIKNKPTIPDVSTLATKTELNAKQDKINDLASIRINSGKGVADMSSNADGTVVYTLANGDTYTLDLNHEHPQYVESDDLADVATSGSYNDLQDKPTIPAGVTVDSTITQNGTNPVQGGAIYSALEGKAGLVQYPYASDLLDNTSQSFGTLGYEYDNERLYFWDDANQEWRQIAETTDLSSFVPTTRKINNKALSTNITLTASDVGALPSSTSIPTKTSDLTNDSGFTSNAGTITGITMNGTSKGTSGVVDLGTVLTSHQDVSGKANKSEMDVSTSGDQTTITLKTGTSATVINQHQSLSGYAKYVLISEADYEALATKDSSTLYLIPEA